MNRELIIAIVTITMALVFYTIGVFSERRSKSLSKNHVFIFWIGLVCDTLGTMTMSKIAREGLTQISATSQMIHGITGLLAILLMLFHALWATWVLYKNDEAKKAAFHKFSIVVWVIWLIPYVIGAMIGMMH